MSSFSHSSLGRDLPDQHRRSASRGGRLSPGPGRLHPQGSRDMMSSDPSSIFGLSSRDLDELARFPEEALTAENLPQIIEHLKKRRAEDLTLLRRQRLSHDTLRPLPDDWNDLRPFRRESFDDRPSTFSPVVDRDYRSHSREYAYQERLELEERLRARDRLRNDHFLSKPPFHKRERDYDQLSHLQMQRSRFENSRGMSFSRKIDDMNGRVPSEYPHVCTLCDISCNSVKSWNEHLNGGHHRNQCLLLHEQFPELAERKMAGPRMRKQFANQSPGRMRRGPDDPHRNFRGNLGNEGMQGPRPIPEKMGKNRVVHLIDFQRGKNLRFQLLKLAKRFGKVTGCFILNKRSEAYIELSTPAEALAIVDHYSNNPALVFGKPIQVHLSQKYQQIKKPESMAVQKGRFEGKPALKRKPTGKAAQKQSGNTGVGCVISLTGFPKSKYTDGAVLKLAKPYGKVKTYILMRMRSQAFIEMERAEDAQTMVDECRKTPLLFQGKKIKVGLSPQYKTLVLRIPNVAAKKQKDKKNDGDAEPLKTDQSELSVVTTEDNDLTAEETDPDLMTASCDPELAEETGEEEATTCLKMSSAVEDGAEVPDMDDLDQKEMSENQGEALEPHSSSLVDGNIRKSPQSFHKDMDDFLTPDKVEDLKDLNSRKIKFEVSEMAENEITDSELGPYQPSNPVGVDCVISKPGFYCRVCTMFYTSEEVAKVAHCSSLAHYQNLQKLMNKTAKSPEKEN